MTKRVRIHTETRGRYEIRADVVSDGKSHHLEFSRWKDGKMKDSIQHPIEQPKTVDDLPRVLNEAREQAVVEIAKRWPLGDN